MNPWQETTGPLEEAVLAGAAKAHAHLGHVAELVDLEQEALLYAATHHQRVLSWWKAGNRGLVAARIRGALIEAHRKTLRIWDRAVPLEEEQ